jgi:formate dehydrogenase iron-sulfur subunit
MILADGGAAYAELGTGRSRGTQVYQLAGNIKQGGIVELPFGVSLRALVDEYGGGSLSGRPVRVAQVGGPLGAYVPAAGFDVAMDYEALAESGAMLGHGGVVVFDDSVDMAKMARFAMEFCSIESCGKCTPCRVGSTRGVETIDRIIAARQSGGDPVERAANLVLLDDLCDTMTKGSLCAMGGLTPMPVQSAIKHFPEDFEPRETQQSGAPV